MIPFVDDVLLVPKEDKEMIKQKPRCCSKEAWGLFQDLTCAYWGKQMYFEDEKGTIYSQVSGDHMCWEEAIKEAQDCLSMEIETNS